MADPEIIQGGGRVIKIYPILDSFKFKYVQSLSTVHHYLYEYTARASRY